MGEESRLRRPSTTREIVEDVPLDVEPMMTAERAQALSIADSFPSPMGQK